MSEITERFITSKNLENMTVLKRNSSTKIPVVLTKDGIIYKLEPTHIVSRFKEYFEILKSMEELSDCVFADEILYLDLKEYGYTTRYLDEYKNVIRIITKESLSIEYKKMIIYKIIQIIKNLHKNGVIHNDLQLFNILVSNTDIKLIDFDQLIIKGNILDSMYKKRVKGEIQYLNLLILSILYDKNLSYKSLEEQRVLINELSLNSEFKEYLNNCLNFNEEQVGEDLQSYVKSVTKKEIIQGKNLIKTLKL